MCDVMWHDWWEQDKCYFLDVELILGFMLIFVLGHNGTHGDAQIKMKLTHNYDMYNI